MRRPGLGGVVAPRRILLLVFNRIGVSTYQRAYHFGRILASRGYHVTLMATAHRARLRLCKSAVEGMQLVETPDLFAGPLRSGYDLWNTLRRIQWLDNKPFDLVHAIESRPVVLFPALFARRQGAKLIMDWCDWFGRGGLVEERSNWLVRTGLRPIETYFEERFRAGADGNVTINSFLRDKAVRLGIPPQTISVIRNGCDVRIPLIEQGLARRLLGLPLDGPLIGYAGAIFPRDAELMADALNRVLRQMPTARIVLIGYFNRVIEHWLDEPRAVIRTGWISTERVFQYLAACDVLWLPLCSSGANLGRWPGKMNDYMVSGRPVVATAVGDLADLIPRYHLGLATQADSVDFSEQTIGLLRNDAQRREFGRAARQAAEQLFSWEHMTDALEAFYQQVLYADYSCP